jgi:hypothetical protein
MKKLDVYTFINRANEIHLGKYDYSESEYTGMKFKINIICSIHGRFQQTPDNHLKNQGCPACGYEKLSKFKNMNTEDFIEKSKKIHGNTYDYSKSKYISAKNKVCIICKKHGEFMQVSSIHQNGSGCPRCGNEKISLFKIGKKRSDEFCRKARLIRIDQISRDKFNGNQVFPSYNPKACKIIDVYGKENGYDFQHAMSGGEYYIKELGYWVDGYDKDKNVVIEYYEKRHSNRIQKDAKRELEIRNHLRCNFIVLYE